MTQARWQNSGEGKSSPEFSPDRLYPCYGITLRLNVFSTSTQNCDFLGVKSNWVVEAICNNLPAQLHCRVTPVQDDAMHLRLGQMAWHNKFISTDPPYYDNVGYADLSDFFYVWLRRSLHSSHSQTSSLQLSYAKDR